ncbi:pollen-specific leucine-rich repeat extensin-like protein 1 isoform X1 [Melia azedarach]|uniref:Pollen-specific leucine-rich repeat extensin-like protein 1 isoform X1 n=1 Tax=Melia azedarach TaxID=155640 RepID=A0ACC1WYH1_MELAZ|nr:pollen-specific leucine-rich repeat extensin-like protein 1 isoform X1 [Melia azedarach]
MAAKVTIMVLKVDLECSKCYKKVKKVLSRFPEIQDQIYDEKKNTVTIKVLSCCPEKLRDKICRKGGGSIKSIEIKSPEKPKEPEKKKEPEKPKEPEKKKEPEKSKEPEKKKEPEKPKDKAADKPKVTFVDPPKSPPKPPVPVPVLVPVPAPCYPPNYPFGVCCPECYGGRGWGPCYHGRGPTICYDGYYGRPVYDSWGGGGGGGCRIM